MADYNDGQSGDFAGDGFVMVNAGFQFVFQVERDLFSVDNEHGDLALLCLLLCPEAIRSAI